MHKAMTLVGILLASAAHAGQTGAFATAAFPMWACTNEQDIAKIMTMKTAKAMRDVAQRSGKCMRVDRGTTIWVHGGNALIEFGGIQGLSELYYYPATGVTYEE
ncbi:hypothetical protein OIU34_19690 [Pararhizobium sp. BT-229]|uniref:hypothetical protein n=1 Tax=Pararhizobium sp. BT-229 TaxID=2986923 RepID=UPI0021F6CA0A|nr:hypothetical protein [Pararhizobium sp. BT-229]MCV9964108.1 hypothetical protein [Pararhizobium sp. BT-229]